MIPILNPEIDERVIYHYCDANALLSILSNERLWFTHAAYLNDTMEITRGVSICRSILDERLQASPDDPVLSSTRSYLENAEKWQYYVCCFCASKDKLSQWRAYANDGNGFAVGFRAYDLSAGHDGPFEGRLDAVHYEDVLLHEKLEALVGEFGTMAHKFDEGIPDNARQFSYDNSGAHIGNRLIDESVFLKDSGFSEEEEWRSVRSYKLEDTQTEQALIANEDPSDFIRVFQGLQQEFIERRLIRNGRYGLTPYIEVSIRPESIREVVCGPRTAKELTESSLEILKKKLGLTFVTSRSEATYR